MGRQKLHGEILKEIAKIDWSQYETAYGNAAEDIPYYVSIGDGRDYMPKAPQSLADLFSSDKKRALRASGDLWAGLCHQHSYVSSAALPAYDILFYGLQNLEDNLKVELLDILTGFAVCTARNSPKDSWQGQLRVKLEQGKPYFQKLTLHPNEDLACFARYIVEAL